MPYKAKCDLCFSEYTAETIGESVLNIPHEPDCDFNKGLSMKPEVRKVK